MSPSLRVHLRRKDKSHRRLKPPPPSLALRQGLDSILKGSQNFNVNHIKSKSPPLPIRRTSGSLAGPKPVNTTNSTSSFRALAMDKLSFAINNSYTGGTSKNHSYAINRFLRFAAKCGVTEEDALPCDSEMLCLWIADGIGRTGVGTASANIAALSAWHRSRDIPFEVPLKMRTIKRALKLHWPEEKQQKPIRPPISPHMIRLLAAAWADGAPSQKCALAIALAAFMGQMRLGELLPVSVNLLVPNRLPSRAKWSLRRETKGTSTIFLPWTKTTGKAGALVTLPLQSAPLDPTMAVCIHLIASPLNDSALLCEFVENGERRMLDKEVFMNMCNNIWSAHDFQRITGHSFRIGGTTSLLLAGVDTEIVKGMGRWSSDAFRRYWRKVEILFAKHASKVHWIDFDI